MTMTWSRSPALVSALMLALNIGMVVVRKAENPTMSGWCSLIASMNFSGATCTPRSMTWNPAPSNMMLTRFLPMSCTSPLTVPITIVPIDSAPVSASSGRRTSMAPAIALPAISISGTKKSPRSKRAPTSSSDGISASKSRVCGSMSRPSPSWVSSSTRGALPTRVSSYSPCRISSGVMALCHPFLWFVPVQQLRQLLGVVDQQPPELGDPLLQPRGRPGDAEGGDDLTAGAAHGYGDTAQADLQLVDGDRPAAPQHLAELPGELVTVGDAVRGQLIEPALGQGQAAMGVEDLAQRR